MRLGVERPRVLERFFLLVALVNALDIPAVFRLRVEFVGDLHFPNRDPFTTSRPTKHHGLADPTLTT